MATKGAKMLVVARIELEVMELRVGAAWPMVGALLEEEVSILDVTTKDMAETYGMVATPRGWQR
jgi:hypothetical protein